MYLSCRFFTWISSVGKLVQVFIENGQLYLHFGFIVFELELNTLEDIEIDK